MKKFISIITIFMITLFLAFSVNSYAAGLDNINITRI